MDKSTHAIAKEPFPPAIEKGCRVWTEYGYHQHGPVDGPKQDIMGPQAGEVTGTEKPYYTMDQLLYSVLWDNGQTSKHYYQELFSIGRFNTRAEFEAAFKLKGEITMKVGPRGGFRSITFHVEYDGRLIEWETRDRGVWKGVIEPAATRDRIEIIRLTEPNL